MTRTDPHRLEVLDPAEYHSVGFEDMHEEEGMVEVDLDDCQDFVRNYRERKLIGDVWVIVGGTNYSDSEAYRYLMEHLEDEAPYGCRICGQAHGNRYWYYFQHEPTGDVIRVGSKCAIMVGLGTREELEDRRAHERRDIAILRGRWLNGDPKGSHPTSSPTSTVRAS